MKPEIIVAMDVANQSAFDDAFTRIQAEITWFKVGLELFCSEGPAVLNSLRNAQKSIFLDLKLHDIPRTVEKAVTSVATHQVDLLTVHASGGRAMLKAAADAAKIASDGRKPLRLLAVTVLTSLDQNDLQSMGIARSPADHALALAENAYACGIDGVVCSLHEAARIRKSLGPDALIVTPGIRMPGDAAGDQKRVGTPRDAMIAGATHLVVGRPILEARDPCAAFQALQREMD